MMCPSCGARKGRRNCPALNASICPTCCGTKRLGEIRCPDSCTWLASSREHPAAVVRKQQEHDVALLLPSLRNLTERQYQLFFLFQTLIARHRETVLRDADVAEATRAFAASLEESVRRGTIGADGPQPAPSESGLPPSVLGSAWLPEPAAETSAEPATPPATPADTLLAEMRGMFDEMRQSGAAAVYDGETALVMRAIEKGAVAISTLYRGNPRAYLELVGRVIGGVQRVGGEAADETGAEAVQQPGRQAGVFP